MPALADYLAKNYLTASTPAGSNGASDYIDLGSDSRRPKKRRKKTQEVGNLLIADDDDDLLLSSRGKSKPINNEDDESGPVIYDSRAGNGEFRRKKQSAWKDATGGTLAQTQTQARDEADSILAAAVADAEQRRQDMDVEDAPAVVDTGNAHDEGPRMSSGAKAGLQTAADTAALIAAETEREKRESKKSRRPEQAKEEETIYRDATGRRIDISMRRAEVRAAELAKQAAEKKDREEAMGDVQRQQREQNKQDLEDAKFLTLGRTEDDEEMNRSLREAVRWDDPMAEYMAKKRGEEDTARGGETRSKGPVADAVVKARPKEYQGAAPPNRYGIKPGWRWDGVDRGNGFEKEWFQARGRKSRNENLEYQWAYDE